MPASERRRRPESISEALQGKVFHFVWVDVVAEAGLVRSRDVAPLVDRWKVRHPDAQQVLRNQLDEQFVAVSAAGNRGG
jgi:hypothetical protein